MIGLDDIHVMLSFDDREATDEDLRRLVRDASLLLGHAFGHPYCEAVIRKALEILRSRCTPLYEPRSFTTVVDITKASV